MERLSKDIANTVYSLCNKVGKPKLYDDFLRLADGSEQEKKEQRMYNEACKQMAGRHEIEQGRYNWIDEHEAESKGLIALDGKKMKVLLKKYIGKIKKDRNGNREYLYRYGEKRYELLRWGQYEIMIPLGATEVEFLPNMTLYVRTRIVDRDGKQYRFKYLSTKEPAGKGDFNNINFKEE